MLLGSLNVLFTTLAHALPMYNQTTNKFNFNLISYDNFRKFKNVATNGNAILETSEIEYILNNY